LLLKIAAEGAAVGHANLTDVTNALDATIVSGVPGITSYSQAMGALNAIVGSGDMTMQDLANAMGTGVMAVAKSYGQSIYQVGAALALFGDNNIRGAKAATELRMAWQAMQAPLTTAGSALSSIGLTSSTLADTMEHHGMSAAIHQFIDALNHSKVPMSDWGQLETEIFGKKAGVGIGIMVDQYGRLMSKFPDLEKGAKGFGSAWAATQKTFDQQWHDFMAGLDALAISFGTVLLPAVTSVLGGLAKFFVFLEHHGEIAVFAGALVALAAGFKIAASMEKLFGEEGLFAEGSLLADPVFLALAAIVLLAAGMYELYKHSKLVRDIVADVGHALERAFKAAVAAGAVAVKWLIGAFDDVAKAVKKLPGEISHGWDDIAHGAATAGHATSHAFSSGWDDVYRDTVGEVVRAFEGVKGAITSGFDGWWKSHGKEVEEVWRAVWKTVSGIFDQAWSAFMADFKSAVGLVEVVWDAVRAATEIAWHAISAEVKTEWDVIAAVFKIGFDAIAAYAKIGWDVAVAVFRLALSEIELIVKSAWDVIAAVFKIVWAAITAFMKVSWDVIVGIFSIALDLITGHWSKAWDDAQTMVQQVWNAIKQFFATTFSAIDALFTQVWNNIKSFLTQVWHDIYAVVVQVGNAIKGFLEQSWNAVVALGQQIWNNLKSFLAQTWHDIYTGVVSAWGSVVTFFEGMPAKILGALGDVGHMLWQAGIDIVRGLINGMKSMYGSAVGFVKGIGHDIKSAFSFAVNLGSPSKDFYQFGVWIVQGLANGITETTAKAEAAARSLAAKVEAAFSAGQITSGQEGDLLQKIATRLASIGQSGAIAAAGVEYARLGAAISARIGSGIIETIPEALAAAAQLMQSIHREVSEGQISASQADELGLKIQEALTSRTDKLVNAMRKMGLQLAAGLLSSIENAATRAQAKSAVDKLITDVQTAWSVGDISLSKASSLTTWLTADNDRLQNLAQKRQALEATIKAADAYANTTTSNTESWAGLSNVTSSMTSGGMVYSGNILSGMKTDLSQINQFSAAIKRLGREGLSKNLLNQLIQMGPEQGLQVATALLDGPLSVIRSMNATQSAINSASSGLGQTAANLMYDSGSMAGKGFLSGLQAQQKNITKMMDEIAKSMIETIEKDLKIHSPSLVTTEHGEMTALGFANGLERGVPWVKGAAHKLAAAAMPGDGHGGGAGAGGTGNVTFNIDIHVPGGFIGNEEQLARELEPAFRSVILQYARRNGKNGLSLDF
jgi:TP901 family phage tail tape measure protein